MEVGLCPHAENGIRTNYKELEEQFFSKKKEKIQLQRLDRWDP